MADMQLETCTPTSPDMHLNCVKSHCLNFKLAATNNLMAFNPFTGSRQPETQMHVYVLKLEPRTYQCDTHKLVHASTFMHPPSLLFWFALIFYYQICLSLIIVYNFSHGRESRLPTRLYGVDLICSLKFKNLKKLIKLLFFKLM